MLDSCQKVTMWYQKHFFMGLMLVVASVLGGCAKDFQGEYSDPTQKEIVDDRWNETDARNTADVLIKSCLDKPWLNGFVKANGGKKPVVIVADVENRTDEHIDTKALTEYIQDELINSSQVRFVNKERRQQILDEIKYQQSGAVSKASAKKEGRQIGADYMLSGAISSSVHSQGGLKTVTYQTNLTLTNLETSEIEWSQKHAIKKRFNRSGAGW